MNKRSYLQKRACRAASALGIAALLAIWLPASALAANPDHMRSNSYILQLGNFNVTSGSKSSAGYKVTDTVGQVAPGEYGTTGYKIYAGFQYLYGLPQFSFRILDLNAELGELIIGSFSNTSHQMVVSTRSGGYAVTAQADHPLRRPGGLGAGYIPFTSCDTSCSITTASTWTNPVNAGFGFNASGTHASSDFINSTYFRPFANAEGSEAAQTIASHNALVQDDVITVSYRASISSSQESGDYQTAIRYTAVPTY